MVTEGFTGAGIAFKRALALHLQGKVVRLGKDAQGWHVRHN